MVVGGRGGGRLNRRGLVERGVVEMEATGGLPTESGGRWKEVCRWF